MALDWAHFTPWSSLAGGVLIGCAVDFGAGHDKATVFVIAMIAGMLLARFADRAEREQRGEV